MQKNNSSIHRRKQMSRVLAVPPTTEYAYGVIYARLSDTRNPNEISIERQIDNGHQYLKANGIPHNCKTDHYTEPPGHRSGWSDKQRPEYRRMRLELPKRAGKGLLWVQAQERFTRAENATTVIRQWIEEIGVDLVFDADLVSLATFDQWLQVHTHTFIHSIESQLGKARMSRYYKKFYDTGAEHRRRPLFGLKIVGTGKDRHNVKNPETLPTVIAFLELYASGKVGTGSLGVRLMRASKYRFQNRQKEWRSATAEHLVSIVNNLEHYQPFLTGSLYARSLKIRESRRRHQQNHGTMKHAPLLFRGLLRCADCGVGLYQQCNPHTGYTSYRHPLDKTDCKYAGLYRAAKPIDAQGVVKLREVDALTARDRKRIIALLTKVPRDIEGERRRAERSALLNARERLVDDWLTAGLSPEEFKKRRQKVDEELERYPELPPPQAQLWDQETAELMFANLPAQLVAAAVDPEVGNALARAFFKECKLDYGSRSVEIKMTWEK